MRSLVVVVVVATGALSGTFALAAPARAEEPRLAVVPLDGLGVDAELLARLDATLRAEVEALALPVVPRADVLAKYAPRPCDGDLACLVALGESVGAARVLAGSIGLAADDLHITLKTIDVASRTVASTLDDAAPADQAEKRLRATTMKLLRPDRYNASGALTVKLALSGAEVVVDGVPRATTPLFGPIDGLPPGRRDVEVRYGDLRPWKGFVDVAFEDPATIELAEEGGAIVLVPRGGTPGEPPAGTQPGLPVLPLAGGGLIAVGVGCGIGAAAAYAVAADTYHRFHDLGVPKRELIQENQTANLVYLVLVTAGVGTVVTGAAF